MSREASQTSEESKLPEYRDEVVSSASNNYLDGACEKSSRLIVELMSVAEDKASSEEENEDQLTGVRSRKLTEKGRSYQTEIKVKSFKSKRSTFTGTLRKTLLLRGQCNELPVWKQEFSKAQVLWNEFTDAYNEIREIVQEDELANVRDMWDQACGEWSNFERDVRDEIKYLEQTVLESVSVSSKGSKMSKSAKSVKSKLSVDTALSTKVEKYKLQQEEAALKVKLAYVEQEKALEIEKLMQEQKLEELRLKRELELSRAKLSVCQEIEKEQTPSLEEDLANLPSESKGEGVKRFLQSLPVSTSTSLANTSAQFQVPLAPVLTTTSTPKSTTYSLRASAPSFSPGAVTQSVFTVRHLEHGHGLPTRGEVPSSQSVTPTRVDPPVTNPFSGPSPIMSTVITPPSTYQPVHPQSQVNSFSEGIERMALSLEKCMDKLTEANLEQSTVSKQLFVSGQLPKLTISVFNGDPLQYPVWKSAFNALVDSRPLEADIKLNMLNQYVTGKPKQVVEHYLLIGTEDAYQKARSVLQERYGNCNVVSTAFINKLENWPKIGHKDATALREFSDLLDKILAAKETIPGLSILDYAKENVKLLAKLPYHLEIKWRDAIKQWRHTHGKASYPTFLKFADFIRDAAEKANIPELESLSTLTNPKVNKNPKPKSKNDEGSSLSTSAKGSGDREPDPSNSSKSERPGPTNLNKCLFCGAVHKLDDCTDFSTKPFSQRRDFFFRERLCMGCAASRSHQVANCKKRLKCKTCSGMHPTCLHKEQTQDSAAVSNCLSVCQLPDQSGGFDHTMIVPVWVRPVGEPEREILQYAFLDDRSNVSFVSQTLCERFNLQGPATELLLTTMQQQNARVKTRKISGLEVLDYHRECVVKMPVAFTRELVSANRSQIPKPEVAREWQHLKPIAEKLTPYHPDAEISILIGNNCPKAIRPREIVAGEDDEPYAQRTILGWGVIGRVCKSRDEEGGDRGVCNRVAASEIHSRFAFSTKAKEIINPENVLRVLETDFVETSTKNKPYSVEDERFLRILEDGVKKRPDGHYEMPLPLKSDNVSLPNNRQLAVKRWNQLNARFKKNPKFFADYQIFMKDLISQCAEKVPVDRLEVQDGKVNYVPHTGVYHPKKPGQIRVVFDCSAQFNGVSLNDYLLQGPEFMNDLLGILCRFRQENVAFMTDIKSMFHQFVVAEEHRDLLRFLWWLDGDPSREVVEYGMKVHLFGASSSPGCANFGLRRAADDGEEEFGADAAAFIRKNFYVDDGLKSVPTVPEAIELIKASQAICDKAGLRLHKIVSNKKEVLEAIPVEDHSKGIKELNLAVDPLPIERALGVMWCVENDSFQFRIELRDRPLTRRGVLSTIGSIYDPNGYIAPVTLKGKQILQQMCRDKLDWDNPVPEYLHPQWEKWRKEIIELEKLEIQRCFKPNDFGPVKAAEMHYFSDASMEGYGQCSYLRLINQHDQVHCSFVVGKTRVTPLKHKTIPRLELAAATISAKMSEFVRNELEYPEFQEFFWTDSRVVLGYIHNEAKRFHVYVANRVQQIRDLTDPNSWFYVETNSNPADEASRGLTARQLVESSRWLTGPEFLWESGAFKPENVEVSPLQESDPEVKKASVLSTEVKNVPFPAHFETSRLDGVSSWYQAVKVIALCLRLKSKFQRREVKKPEKPVTKSSTEVEKSVLKVTLPEFQEAEKTIIRCLQYEHFHAELQILCDLNVTDGETNRVQARKRNQELRKTSSLYKLDPFVDQDGLIRVGGRIRRADVPIDVKHPVIIPRKGHLTELLIKHHHQKVNHMGRGMTHNELRQSGYWLINGSSGVARLISGCVTCRRLRRPTEQQKMACLPEDRLEPAPPFSYCAVDYFGPFIVKERRSEVKRYGVLFTCMGSRSVHLETANSLDSSSFINALSRFLNRRGAVRQLRSDQGTNFVGARNELKAALSNMNQDHVQEYLLRNGCEWIPFKMNLPHCSHMGGTWERLIRSVRNALEPLLSKAGSQLDDETLRTLMTEVECIINSRPLSVDYLCDAEAPEPLTPNHLLTMKPKRVLPPPGEFQRADVYCRRRWRRVQYFANEFWLRWRKEYLQMLQVRQKWVQPKRNLAVGDVVISKESEGARNKWPLGRVVQVYPSEDGFVRKVKLLMADGDLDDRGKRQGPPSYLERPIHKLVLLLTADEVVGEDVPHQETGEVPIEEPTKNT